MKRLIWLAGGVSILGMVAAACGVDGTSSGGGVRSSSASYTEAVRYEGSQSSAAGAVFEVLPGPAALNPMMAPTPFSDRIAIGSGNYSLTVRDVDAEDSEQSLDEVEEFSLWFQLDDGTTYVIDGIDVIHKESGAGDHSFLGGVGFDVTMHGDTGIGIELMPKMTSYITLWGTTDLKDGAGNVIAANRLIHIMVASRARTSDLDLITDTSSTPLTTVQPWSKLTSFCPHRT